MNIFTIFLQNFSKVFSKTHQIAPFFKIFSEEHAPNPPSKRGDLHIDMNFPRKILTLPWDDTVQLITYYQVSSYEH